MAYVTDTRDKRCSIDPDIDGGGLHQLTCACCFTTFYATEEIGNPKDEYCEDCYSALPAVLDCADREVAHINECAYTDESPIARHSDASVVRTEDGYMVSAAIQVTDDRLTEGVLMTNEFPTSTVEPITRAPISPPLAESDLIDDCDRRPKMTLDMFDGALVVAEDDTGVGGGGCRTHYIVVRDTNGQCWHGGVYTPHGGESAPDVGEAFTIILSPAGHNGHDEGFAPWLSYDGGLWSGDISCVSWLKRAPGQWFLQCRGNCAKQRETRSAVIVTDVNKRSQECGHCGSLFPINSAETEIDKVVEPVVFTPPTPTLSTLLKAYSLYVDDLAASDGIEEFERIPTWFQIWRSDTMAEQRDHWINLVP